MISIISGVYNAEGTLRAALDSILAQTCSDWEYIICDDASTDGTAEILREYSSRDARFRVMRNDRNLGLAASLNRCITFVRGEYIARMDGDDISLPERFEKQLSYLQSHPETDAVGCWMKTFGGEVDETVRKDEIPTKYLLPKEAPFHHATVMMKAETMKKLGGYKVAPSTLGTEDVELWNRFFAEGHTGYNIGEVLYHVRVDDGAIKRRKFSRYLRYSKIIREGVKMNRLPLRYNIYCLKPILSFFLPEGLKRNHRQRKASSR